MVGVSVIADRPLAILDADLLPLSEYPVGVAPSQTPPMSPTVNNPCEVSESAFLMPSVIHASPVPLLRKVMDGCTSSRSWRPSGLAYFIDGLPLLSVPGVRGLTWALIFSPFGP